MLKLPEIPSILIETAYISNPGEEKLLRSSAFQTEIAKAIAASVTEFMPVQPGQPTPTPTIVLTKKDDERKAVHKPDKTDKLRRCRLQTIRSKRAIPLTLLHGGIT